MAGVGVTSAVLTVAARLLVGPATEGPVEALPAETLVLAALVTVLLVVTGTAFAVLLPPESVPTLGDPGRPRRSRRSGVLLHPLTTAAPVAVVTIVAMLVPLMPATGAAAAEGTGGSTSAVTDAPAVTPAADAAPDVAPEAATGAAVAPGPQAASSAPAPALPSSATPAPAAPAAPAPARAAAVTPHPTTVDVQLSWGTVLGDDQEAWIDVTADGTTDVPTGSVVVHRVDADPTTEDEEVTSFDLADGSPYLVPTARFGAADVDLRFTYVPDDAAFAGSERVVDAHYQPARLTPVHREVRHTPSSPVPYGAQHTLTVVLESSADADGLQLDLRDQAGWTLVASTPFSIVDGKATVVVDLTGKLTAGQHDFVYEVPATSTHEGTGSEAPSVVVEQTTTTTTLTLLRQEVLVGDPAHLGVKVVSDSGAVVDRGFVVYRRNGVEVQRVPVYAGDATWTWTATTTGPQEWTVEYHDPARGFGPSEDTASQDVVVRPAPRPTFSWTVGADVEDAVLTGTFPAWTGLSAPTGTVTVSTTDGVDVGRGTLAADGSVRVPVAAPRGAFLLATYGGDTVYAAETYALPHRGTVTYRPEVTLSAPATATVDGTVALDVTVDGVPADLLRDVEVVRQRDGAGAPEAVGRLDLAGGLSGRIEVTERTEGDWTYTASATFDPSAGVLRASSAPATVTWSLPAEPLLGLEVGAGPFASGEAVPVTVTAAALPGGGHGVPAGTEATITGRVDGRPVLTATVVLTAGADGGLRGTTTVTRELGGTVELTATVRYGTRPWTATSASGSTTIEPPVPVVSIAPMGPLRVGSPATFEVRYAPSAPSLAQVRGFAATVTVGDRRLPVSLEQPHFGLTVPSLVARVTVDVVSAADLTATVTVPGDGVLHGTATATTTEHVAKLATRVRLEVPATATAGLPLLVGATVTNDPAVVTGVAPHPTGEVVVTAQPSGLGCTVPAGASWCALPGEAVVPGHNALVATYAGDADHDGSTAGDSVTGSSRRTTLNWKASPALESVVSGQPVTFSWTVATGTTLRDPAGTVEVALGGASCRADVSVGRCTLTVPLPPGLFSSTLQQVTVRFVPSDDAVGATDTTTVTPRDCVVVGTVAGLGISLEGDPAAACRRQGQDGFLTGTWVTARHAAVAAPYAFESWTVEGGASSRAAEYEFRTRHSFTIGYQTRYAPVCHTLSLDPGPARVARSDPSWTTSEQYRTKGGIVPLTEPNCASPVRATPEELQELKDGRPRYAEGTDVDVRIGSITSWTDAQLDVGTPYVVDTVTGATPTGQSPDLYRTTMTGDRTVSATFRARDCTVVTVREGQGGSQAVTASVRPEESRWLRPADGTCTDPDGRQGYVPGSTLTVTATPDEGNYLGEWRVPGREPLRYRGGLVDPYSIDVIGDAPRDRASGAAGAASRTFVVPKPRDTVLDIGVVYQEVRCIPVTTSVVLPVDVGGAQTVTPTTFVDVEGGRPSDALGCGPRHTGPTAGQRTGGTVEHVQTDWFVGTAVLRVERDSYALVQQFLRNGSGERYLAQDQSYVRWGVAEGAEGVAEPGTDTSGKGPVLRLASVPDTGARVVARYVSDTCRPVEVTYPQGGTLETWSDGSRRGDTGVPCPPGTGAVGDSMWMKAAQPAASGIVPIVSRHVYGSREAEEWPEGVTAADGRRYIALPAARAHLSTVPSAPMRLEYCVPLDLRVMTQDREGGFRREDLGAGPYELDALAKGGWADLVAKTGGCPPLWARPGDTVTVGLTDVGAFGYDLVEGERTVAVPTDGSMPVVELRLRAKCARVSVGDRVDLVNAPNCGHDASAFVLGSAVQLQADVPSGGRLNSWSGVDASENATAWVVVTGDRQVSADIHVPNLGERIANGLSSVAQRIVALGVVVLTGIALMEMTLVKVLGMAMTGISMGLKAAGASGAALDGFDRATAIVTAQTALPSMLSGCVSDWAHGPSLTQANLASKVGAAGSVFVANKAAGLVVPQVTIADRQAYDWVVNTVDAFGSGSYLQDARGQWSAMGSSLGGCLETRTEQVIDPIIKKY